MRYELSTARPIYGGGGVLNRLKNWYNNDVSQNTKDVLSFVPFLGSAIDGIEMVKNPSLVNGIGLATSIATDALGGRLLYKAGKAMYKVYKTRKALRALERTPIRLANRTSYLTNKRMQRDTYNNLLVDIINRERAKRAVLQSQKYDALVNLGQVGYNRLTK